MKKVNSILVIILFIITGCGENKQSADELITVNVTKTNYSKKELILQNFMDVEYISLETNDDFLNQGIVLDIGKETLLVKNRNDDGDIFVYDRTGKALRKINRKGQGGEEYLYALGITLDEDNNELFVNDHYTRKVLVYDLYGKFKRSFRHNGSTSGHKGSISYDQIYNFDRENLICHDGFFSDDMESNRQSFMIISKQDGSIVEEIQIPLKEKISSILTSKDDVNNMIYAAGIREYPIIPCFNKWILVEPSSDTLYCYLPDSSMIPLMARTPSVQSTDPALFLFPCILTDRYYFLQAVKKEYNFSTNKGFPRTDLMYDRQEKSIFEYRIYNGDFSAKKSIDLVYGITLINNSEIAFTQKLEAYQLVESYKKGELKGKLKEIASQLDEEDNPVIMLVKHKK